MQPNRVTPGPTFSESLRQSLKALTPEAFADGAINWDSLREALGEYLEPTQSKSEHYGLFWPGKRDARRLAALPSHSTLLPDYGDGVRDKSTANVFIEGENLETLKLLQKAYAERVKLIYIDPPYNTGKDFVYKDSFTDPIGEYLEKTGQADKRGALTTNTRADGRFHSNWLSMMYPRLRLARNLLRPDGVLMVSIDDGEINTLKSLATEIFGEENFLAILIWNKQHSQQQGLFKRYHEYVLVYAKSADTLTNIVGGEGEIDAGAIKRISRANPASEFTFPAGVRFEADEGFELRGTYGDSEQVTVVSGRLLCRNGKTAEPVTLSAGWTQKKQMQSYFSAQETFDSKGQKVLEFYFSSTGKLKCRKARTKVTPPSLLPEYGMVSEQTDYLARLLGAPVFSNPKPVRMMADFIGWFSSTDDIVMDFFAGSGTLGEALYEKNIADGTQRRFLLVQFPEKLDASNPDQRASANYCAELGKPPNIAELTKERLRRASAKLTQENPTYSGDLGFRVLKLGKSNYKAWREYSGANVDDLQSLFEESEDPLVPGWSSDGLITEVMLLEGFPLDSAISSSVPGSGIEVMTITSEHCEHRLLVSLDKEIEDTEVEALNFLANDVFVCLDSALTDQNKQRLADRCTLKTI